jgi:predicted Ser/Thr protein kinase
LTADLGPERLAERYELVAELGRGAFGVVYKARDLRAGGWVAIKVLHEHLAQDARLARRLAREARVLAELEHPHIVGFRGLGSEGGRAFVVMEYVDGQPLAVERAYAPVRALGVARQLCDALEYAHKRGLVHRDLKPGNVLVDRDGNIKVADFGIAAWLPREHGDTRLTLAQERLGTPGYMAPEAARGDAPHARQDVYSLGVLLYQMVMGHLPSGYFALPPEPFGSALRGALAGEPLARTASIVALRRALDIEAPPPALPPEERTRGWAVAALTALAAALVLDTLAVALRVGVLLAWLPGAALGVMLTFISSGLGHALRARWQRLGYRGRQVETFSGTQAVWCLACALVAALLGVAHDPMSLLVGGAWTGLANVLRLVALAGVIRDMQEADRGGRRWREDWRLLVTLLAIALPLLVAGAVRANLLAALP